MVGLNGHKGRICFQFNKTAAAHFSIILHTKVQLPTICGGSSPSWHRSDNWKAKQAKLGKLRRWRSLWPSWRDRTQFRRVDGQIVEMMRTRRKKRELGVVMVKKKTDEMKPFRGYPFWFRVYWFIQNIWEILGWEQRSCRMLGRQSGHGEEVGRLDASRHEPNLAFWQWNRTFHVKALHSHK